MKIKKNIRPFIFIFFLIAVNFNLMAGVMATPRHVNLLKTEHFDIIFPVESEETVKLLADNVDELYNRAKEQLVGANDLRIPIVVSPDSDRLSVEYTSSPYNRIVFFDGVPEDHNANFKNALLGLFYHEIYLALSLSIRSPINQFIYKTVGGDSYQPISMIYLPFSFVEGRAFVEDGTNNDKFFLQILSIAKYEGKFPNWLQAGTVRDIFPGRQLNDAAGSAFAAYLMQTYGIEKYHELWSLCGDLTLNLTAGIFKKVYGISIKDLWQGFEDSIPLPDNIEEIREIEKNTKKLFPNERECSFENLLLSDYGLIWYDNIRHEVDIYDWNSTIKMRQLLFLAEDVEKLSLSPDGRWLVVSFYGIKNRPQFRNDRTWIYDLKERQFLKFDFGLRDCVITDTDDDLLIWGVNVQSKKSVLECYSLITGGNKGELLITKEFNHDEYPNSLTYSGNNKVSYLLTKNGINKFCQYDIKTDSHLCWDILYKDKPVKIKNLRVLNKDKKAYSFSYLPEDENGFIRLGIILLDDKYNPTEVYFQTNDVAGGIQWGEIYNNNLMYCADKFSHKEIHILPLNNLSFVQGQIYKSDYVAGANENQSEEKTVLDNYDIKRYNPFKYMLHFSVVPFMAIKDLAATEEQGLWPSLGGTIITQDDPFMNNRIMISGAGGYAKLDFTKTVNPTTDDINEEKVINVDDNKNISVGISIENTSTPIDFRGGCLFKFSTEGAYNFGTSLNAFFQLPIGMAFSNLNFSILTNYTASTDYYDRNLSDIYPGLSDWPSFSDAYETTNITVGIEYTNVSQFGISKYQQRGFSFGLKLDTFWDIYEIRLLNKKYKEMEKGETLNGITKAQRKKLYEKDLLEMSQLNLGFFGEVMIPKLNPFSMKHNLVLNMPTTIKAEILNEIGTAVHLNIESLLLGYEPQNGIPNLYLFFSRLGLLFGYDLKLNYDTYKVPIPDFRRKNFLWDVFSNIYVRDSIYLIYDMDFSASIGCLSEYQMNLNMKTEFFPHSKGFAFTINFRVAY